MKLYVRSGMIALFILLSIMLSGCTPLVDPVPEPLSVYSTFYPVYALTELVVKDIPDLEHHCLVQPQDGCLRAYGLSDWDAYMLAYSADAVIAGGCGLESFEALLQSVNNLAVATIMNNMELYHSEAAPGENETHWAGDNPHLYMSIDGAKQMIESIATSMSAMDAKYAGQYAQNMDAAIQSLDALNSEMHAITGDISGRKVVVMNEAMVYVARDYGLEMAAWIDRESGVSLYETELEDCLNTLAKSGAKVVLIEKQAPKPLVDALEAAGYAVAQLDILSTYGERNGAQMYFEAMRKNAEALAAAFEEQ